MLVRELSVESRPPRSVDLAFYERVVACSRKERWAVIMLSDLAYSELYYDGKPTPSILQVKRREGRSGRVHIAQQDLFDGGLADGVRGRQSPS